MPHKRNSIWQHDPNQTASGKPGTLQIKDGKPVWVPLGWKSIYDVSAWLAAGHEVLTGKVEEGTMHHGDAVELELRIAHNGTNYKLGDMPDA